MKLPLASLVLAIAAPALADDTSDAQRLYAEGQARYRAGDYAAAAEAFRAAWEHVHDPVYLFNIAQSYRFAILCDRAAQYYRQFLSAAPNAPNRDKVQQWIAEMDGCATPPAPPPSPAPSPSPSPSASPISISSPPLDEPPSSPGQTKRIAGLALGGAGVVALGLGVYFQHRMSDVIAERDAMCHDDSCPYEPTLHAFDERGARFSHDAIASYSIGGAAIVTGVVLYMLGHRERDAVVAPTRNGVALVMPF